MYNCSWKEQFGVDCLTCGFQRSVELLIQGDVVGSFKMFPPTIPFLICVLFVIVHIFKKFKNGHKIIIGLFSLTSGLIVINYLVKLINGNVL